MRKNTNRSNQPSLAVSGRAIERRSLAFVPTRMSPENVDPVSPQNQVPQVPQGHCEIRETLRAIEGKEAAISVVQDIIDRKSSRFELVPSSVIQRYQKLRSSYYKGFQFLCHMNSKKHACWLLCNFALTGH